MRITPSSAASFISQQVEVETTTTLGCGVQSCAACPDGEVQSLCDAVQACTVINCIGTPINMRRVLCQLGETFADEARESLSVLYGGWVVFVDMFMVLMELSLRKGLLGITVSFPDDAFFGYVCTAKDQSAHLISIFTSAINDAVQIAHSAVLYLQGGAQEIDSNFSAQVTMPLTAPTSFLYHMTLWPLYGLIAPQKVMMCRVEGLAAVFDVASFGVSIGDATMEAASDTAVGHCLTQNFATQMADPAANTQTTAHRDAGGAVHGHGARAVPDVPEQCSALQPGKQSTMHLIDAAVSFLMGAVSALADLVQSLDMAHCQMPDYFLRVNETVFCLCNDTPFGVPPSRAQEGLAGACLWCTGTLPLLDASNQPFVAYNLNPYTYPELQALAPTSRACPARPACRGRPTATPPRTMAPSRRRASTSSPCSPPARPTASTRSGTGRPTSCSTRASSGRWCGRPTRTSRSRPQLRRWGRAWPTRRHAPPAWSSSESSNSPGPSRR